MEISGIRSSLPFLFSGAEKENPAVERKGDIVDIQHTNILSDEEAEVVFQDTLGMIGADAANALSVHSGLTESRVFALLGV